MIKVMTVVGTRREIIRLSRIISILDKNTEHTLVHTGQNYDFELNGVFLKILALGSQIFFLNQLENSIRNNRQYHNFN